MGQSEGLVHALEGSLSTYSKLSSAPRHARFLAPFESHRKISAYDIDCYNTWIRLLFQYI